MFFNNLNILTFHNIDESNTDWFKAMISSLHRRIGFIDPKNLANNQNDCGLILTFDDGYKSNAIIAEKILNPLGIKALFFVTNNFIGLSPKDSHKFAAANFFPTRLPCLKDGDLSSMNWDDIRQLKNDGHYIGAHTFTHPNLKLLHNYKSKYHEIVDSADEIEDEVRSPVVHFAYPYGNLDAVDADSIAIAKLRFRFAYSNIRGDANRSPCKHFIFRQNIVPGMSLLLLIASILGILDIKYINIRKRAFDRFT